MKSCSWIRWMGMKFRTWNPLTRSFRLKVWQWSAYWTKCRRTQKYSSSSWTICLKSGFSKLQRSSRKGKATAFLQILKFQLWAIWPRFSIRSLCLLKIYWPMFQNWPRSCLRTEKLILRAWQGSSSWKCSTGSSRRLILWRIRLKRFRKLWRLLVTSRRGHKRPKRKDQN